jgi:hypothetical protein
MVDLRDPLLEAHCEGVHRTRAAEYFIAINQEIIDSDLISFRRPATGRIGIGGAVLEPKPSRTLWRNLTDSHCP